MILDDYNEQGFGDFYEGLSMKAYTADFETTTDLDDCRVWAYAICDIENPDFVLYGNSIEDFMAWCEVSANCKLYFHNLAFDGAFIMDWLERNGWRWVEARTARSDKTYTTVIGEMNQVYAITLYFTPYFKVDIWDSLKIIPLGIADIAKSYGLEESKGSLDYEKKRERGHILSEEEKEYIRLDVQIAAKAMKIFLDEGLNRMTAGSNALSNYRLPFGGNRKFRRLFPEIPMDKDKFLRKAYRGGFTYVNPKYKGLEVGEGIVLDVNSLYPSVMASVEGQLLPYGEPKWFDGKPTISKRTPLYIALVTFSFKIKTDHLPCIQIKGNFRYKATEFLEDSCGDVTIAVTNVDWDLICQQYDVWNVSWFGGFYFKGADWLFTQYVENWVEIKNEAAREGNKGRRQIAKLMLNSLYGKFATRREVCGKRPMLVDDVLRYVPLEPEEREGVYLPVGVFITSWARYKTITSAQSVYDRFLYADTDSLHLLGTDIPENLWVDDYELGAWKIETEFERAKFLHAKCYVEDEKGKQDLTVHVSGMPKRCHKNVALANFEEGATYYGKLYTKRVPGGIVLVEGDMQIRGN